MNKLLGISGTPVHLCDGGRREHEEERTDLPALGACISDCLLELGLLGTQFSLYLRDIALQAQEFALQPVQLSLQPMDMLQPLVELYIQIADGLLAALHLLAGTVEFVLRLLERLLQFGLLALQSLHLAAVLRLTEACRQTENHEKEKCMPHHIGQ